jgi:hypothetical protein
VSVYRSVSLGCDWPRCPAHYPESMIGNGPSVREARKRAAKHGWAYLAGDDFCAGTAVRMDNPTGTGQLIQGYTVASHADLAREHRPTFSKPLRGRGFLGGGPATITCACGQWDGDREFYTSVLAVSEWHGHLAVVGAPTENA